MKNFYYYTPVFLQKVGYLVFYFLHKIFVRIEVRGRENLLGLKGPVILAANHTSELDVTVTPLILGFFSYLYPLYCVTDPKEKFKTFGWRNYIYGGLFFNILGGYPIHSGHHDYSVSLENHLELLKQGRTVFIFPEGKRTRDGNLNPGRGGLGFMVYETKATVIPIFINTFFGIGWKDYFSFSKKVVITILDPLFSNELITTASPGVEDFRLASQKVLDRIQAAY